MEPLAVFLFLFLYVNQAAGYRIVIFVPTLSNSQVLLNYRLGELLAEAGHQVTMYRPRYNSEVTKGKPIRTKELRFDALKGDEYRELHDRMQGPIFTSASMATIGFGIVFEFHALLRNACEAQIQDKSLLAALSEHDLAIVHPYDMCPMGLVRAARIPSWIWMSSTTVIDFMAAAIGCPSPPSFVPNIMSGFSDRMSAVERFKNFLGAVLTSLVVNHMVVAPSNELFRKHFGPEFPDVLETARQSQLMFINGEEFLDFPRPILHKIVYVGGIGMRNSSETLNTEWKQYMDNSKDGVVLFSMGSVANSSSMPSEWKSAFLRSFSRFPSFKFIWKYESDDLTEAKEVKNVRLSKWVPQRGLFGHPKMRAFITHGGYNSLIEAAYSGVPLISIPLFGDQYGNARRAEKRGVGLSLDKTTISEGTISAALQKILLDTKYAVRAKRLSAMLMKKPNDPEKTAVKWVEFLAEFQQLPNLEPTSTELNFFQYYLLDCFAAIVVCLAFACYLFLVVVRYYCWWCCQSTAKRKKK